MHLLKLISVAIFSLALSAHGAGPATYGQLKGLLSKTTKKDVIELVQNLVAVSAPSRMVGTSGHEKARAWIVEKIREFDPKGTGKVVDDIFSPDIEAAKTIYQRDFDEQVKGKFSPAHPEYLKWKRFTDHMLAKAESLRSSQGRNIIWEKQGINTDKWLIISAHYDTISHDHGTLLITEGGPMPGANYNASGVAVALSILKNLANLELNYSVQVIFLDFQGVGFLGSRAHARSLKSSDKNVIGVINLEMLGQDTKYYDKSKKFGNMSVFVRADQDEKKWVKGLVNHGQNITKKVDFAVRPVGFDNSDNIRYWEDGFKSATFTQNWEEDFNKKFYQTPQDTPETLNQETLFSAYQYLGGAVLGTLLDITK